MRTMRTRTFLMMAAFALAFQAHGESISSEDAKAVACGWSSRMCFLYGGDAQATDVSEGKTDGGATFFAVRMSDGSTVFTSGDDEIEPVIAYSPSGEDYSSIDRKSPLWALLNRDLTIRQAAVTNDTPSAYVARRRLKAARNRVQWQELRSAAVAADSFGLLAYDAMSAAAARRKAPKDLRVDMLMQTQWGQGDVGGQPCYNYYTPKNYVCGCVATALGQLLRYNHGPVEDGGRGLAIAAIPSVTRKIAVDGDKNLEDRTTEGGEYAWDMMPLTPSSSVTDEQRQTIGKLLYEAGVALNMSYAEDGSGSYMLNQNHVLLETYGYKQVLWLSLPDGAFADKSSRLEQDVLFANFDSGNPVLMSIPGHAIVADGYGFEGETPYVHLNMGWEGQCDFWYNLPDMTAAGAEYTVVDGVNYNIFKEEGSVDAEGQTTAAILSGRVLDDEGQPREDCEVTVSDIDSGEIVGVVTSDVHGVWSLIAQAGTYDLTAKTADGEWIGVEEGVLLETAKSEYATFTNFGSQQDKIVVASPSKVGNSWGHDLELIRPSVRVGSKVFSSLDKAIVTARAAAAEIEAPQIPVLIEVIDTTTLKAPATIDFNCALVATNDDPYASAITRLVPAMQTQAAALTVSNGCVLALSNIVFATDATVAVNVETGGVVAVAGTVDFGVTYELPGLRTADASGFVLAGELGCGITLDCTAATKAGDVFGSAVIGPEFDLIAASNAAARIASASDPYGELRGIAVDEGGQVLLKWDAPPVPLADAVGYYVTADGETNTTARLDRLIEKFEDARVRGMLGGDKRMVVLRPGCLTRPLTVGEDIAISGASDLEIACETTAGFVVTNGTLTVEGLTFSDYPGSCLFTVNGASADLNMTDTSIVGANGKATKYSPAVTVKKGQSHLTRVSLRECKSKHAYGCGGGIYCVGGTTNHLDSCTIKGCWALSHGGGLYAEKGACVGLAGAMAVSGNTSGGQYKADDIFLADGKAASILVVEGALTGRRVVGVLTSSGNEVGAAFGRAAADAGEEAFFCDSDATLDAEVVDSALVWKVSTALIGSTTDGPGMVVVVSNVLTKTELFYEQVVAAFAEITGDSVVTIRTNVVFDADLEVRHAVTLRSDPAQDEIFDLDRSADCSMVVLADGSLRIVDCYVYGCTLDEDGMPSGTLYKAPLILVDGGELTLDSGSGVGDAFGYGSRSANAVTVRNGGKFTLEPDAEIFDCGNSYHDYTTSGVADGAGGGLLLDGSVAYLNGGSIDSCNAMNGGGVFAGNGSRVYVSGDIRIERNLGLDDYLPRLCSQWSDLVVAVGSELVLAGDFDGLIGYAEGINGDTNVFGRVDAPLTASVIASATNFWHNATHARGVVATNETGEALLVWADAFVTEGGAHVYRQTTDEGQETVYYAAMAELPAPADIADPDAEPEYAEPGPIAFAGITRLSDTEWQLVVTGRTAWCNYRLLGTDDLSKGFTVTGDWEQAVSDGAWTTNVTVEGEFWFWSAEGARGEIPLDR